MLNIILQILCVIFDFFNIILNNKSINDNNNDNKSNTTNRNNNKLNNISEKDSEDNINISNEEIIDICRNKYMSFKQLEQLTKNKGKYKYICVFNDIKSKKLYKNQLIENSNACYVWKNWGGNGESSFGITYSHPIIYKVVNGYMYLFQIKSDRPFCGENFMSYVYYWLRVRNYCYITQYKSDTSIKKREKKRFHENYGYINKNYCYIKSQKPL